MSFIHSLFLEKNKLSKLLYFFGAFVAFVSLKPYIFWKPSHWLWSIIFTSLYLLIAMGYFFVVKNNWYEEFKKKKYSLALAGIFLVYISVLPTYNGSHKLWFLIYPILFCYLLLERNDLEKTFKYFKSIFIISLIPALLYQLLMVLGVDFSFNILHSTEPLKAIRGIGYLELPGAVFQSSCSHSLIEGYRGIIDIHNPLPSRIISRICGLYVEPGVVGTLSILILSTQRNFKSLSSLFLITVGIMTLSLAFIISFPILLFLRKEWRLLFSSLGGLTFFIFLLFKFGSVSFFNDNIISRIPTSVYSFMSKSPENAAEDSTSVNYSGRNDRESEEFKKIITIYWQSFPSILFGVASDASEYSDCSTYKLILSNYGLIGLLLLSLFFIAMTYEYNKGSKYHLLNIVFMIMFFINFLQRPYIWMPFYILIYLYGILPQKQTPNASPQKVVTV